MFKTIKSGIVKGITLETSINGDHYYRLTLEIEKDQNPILLHAWHDNTSLMEQLHIKLISII